jgi:hypothetical protein
MDLKETETKDVDWIRLSGHGPVASSCGHGNEFSGSKVEEFFDHVNDYDFFTKYWSESQCC